MTELVCRNVEKIENAENFPDYIRRTKTVCLWNGDRPNVKSKALARITIKTSGGEKSDIFCVDARGSKKGHLTAHPSHFKSLGLEADDKVQVEVSEATAEECASWLLENADPERKAFGLILNKTIDASQQARENLDQARFSEAKAKAYKEKSVVYAAAAFIAGSLLDIGMIEDKFGLTVPPTVIVVVAIVAVILFLSASRIAQLFRENTRP
ncbi:MAG: hypothetical protein ABJJ53_16560 [Sulfitobacter sp.]